MISSWVGSWDSLQIYIFFTSYTSLLLQQYRKEEDGSGVPCKYSKGNSCQCDSSRFYVTFHVNPPLVGIA